MDPLERGCYSSLPSPEIWGLKDQQSLFWPKKGVDSSEAGTLLIQQQRACQSGHTAWWAMCCSRYLGCLEDLPATVGVLLSLVLSLQGAAMNIRVWEILMSGYLEVSHRNHSSWRGRLSAVSAKGNFQAFPPGLIDQKWGCYQGQQVNIKSPNMCRGEGEMLLSNGLLSCCFQQIHSFLHFSTYCHRKFSEARFTENLNWKKDDIFPPRQNCSCLL